MSDHSSNGNNNYDRGNNSNGRHQDKNGHNDSRRGGPGGGELGGGSIPDSLRETTKNIESSTNKQTFDLKLEEEIKKYANKERKVRESTIMIKNTERVDQKYINTMIEKEWSNDSNKTPPIL